MGLYLQSLNVFFLQDDDELPAEKRVEIRENVEDAMRDGNLYNDATTEDEGDTEPEDESETLDKQKGELALLSIPSFLVFCHFD